MKGQVFWMVDPEADAITSPFVRQPHYADLEARIRRIETVVRKLVPENERENVGLSAGSLRALQSMVASQASGEAK